MSEPGSRAGSAAAVIGAVAAVAAIVAVAATFGVTGAGAKPSGAAASVSTTAPATIPAIRPSPEALHLEGSHQGVEHFAIATTHCREVDSHLVETFLTADGSSWAYDTRYCGTITNNLWSGSGPFSMTAADGSQFTGTHTNSALLPGTGVPYELDVTGGTKRFAGASGSCVIEEHLRQTQFGVQLHSGSFVCDLKTK